MLKQIMLFLSPVFISLITLLGLIFGHVLSVIAKEEVNPGKKYFKLAEKILLILLFLVLIYSALPISYIGLIFFCAGLVLAMLIKRIYLWLGLASFISLYTPFVLLINSLILLFGLPYGTLLQRNKIISSCILFSIPFLVYLALLLFFQSMFAIQNNILFYYSNILVFSAGTLIPAIFINKDN
jgi:hypothetical protein